MSSRFSRAVSAISIWLIVSFGYGYEMAAITEYMGSKHGCKQNPSDIHWISEKTSAQVIGKSEESVKVCQLKFGLATNKDTARLRLSFDFIYNHDCGVHLQINQSVTTDFYTSTSNKEMFMYACHTKNPGLLYAHPKNFVLISLVKDRENMEAYNFRLNISMAEHLPSRGLELHVVIIVGFVLSAVVMLAGFLLFKYVTRLTYDWNEQRSEEAMTRAINIYNSQEPLEEPHLVYIRPGGGNQTSKNYTPGSQIAFVHSDGRVERFRPLNDTAADTRAQPSYGRQSNKATEASRVSQEPQNPHLINHNRPSTSFQQMSTDLESVTSLGPDLGDAVSLGGCDVPPTYEEALGMPMPADVSSAIGGEDSEAVSITGRLEIDYFNMEIPENGGVQQESAARDGDDEELCDSGTTLLPADKCL